MSTIVRNALILLFCVVISIYVIVPPEKKLRLGKDLAGGATLVYAVDIKPTDPSDTMGKVVQVIKDRLDPNGALEISVVPQGTSQLEITMPLPSERVKALRKKFDEALNDLGAAGVTRDDVERASALAPEQRSAEITRLAAGDAQRQGRLELAMTKFQELQAARAALTRANADLKDLEAKTAGGDDKDPAIQAFRTALVPARQKQADLVRQVAKLEIEYEPIVAATITQGLQGEELRRALTASDQPLKLKGANDTFVTYPSPREEAIKSILTRYEAQRPAIEKAIEAWRTYDAERTSLDDPQDIVRILRGAGVLNFRITCNLGEHPQETEARDALRKGGPAAVRIDDAQFFKVNKIDGWVQSVTDYENLKKSPAAYFAGRNLVAEEYKGAYYVLCWDRRGLRLTEQDGQWSVAGANAGNDQYGRSAIDFRMDALGADKLGDLTGKNVGRAMAVLLDDEVYTAPTLQSRISHSGQITGSFTRSEIDYITRVLGAGSLKAKLSPEPVSSSIVGPSLGADNLQKSFHTGIVAFLMVAAFMIIYYFTSGAIAVVALVFNSLLVIAMMVLNHSAFSIPAIAGIILTFGQAVDSNVLIYERVREELQSGHDLRTSVRLGFSRALAPIVDGNVSNLIICVVLGFFGTEEIRGFAITLGIGVATTLFSTLFLTRFIFTVMIEHFGWRKTSQLPMSVPFVQRLFSPHVDWMKHRWTLLGALTAFLVASTFVAIHQGADMLGMEFRSGTAVTLTFKRTGEGNTAKQEKMRRPEVEARVKEIATAAPQGSALKLLDEAQVIAVNPDSDNITSGTFTIKSLITDPNTVQQALVGKFLDKLDVRQELRFEGWNTTGDRTPTYAITTPDIGAVIDMPGRGGTAPEFQDGVAIVLKNLTPPVSLAEITERLQAARQKQGFTDSSQLTSQVRVLEGTEASVASAVVLVRDAAVRAEDKRVWETELRDKQWGITLEALTQSETLAGVQSFSPAIARNFAFQGIVCTLLSMLLLTIYVFVRFGTLRWAVAAVVPLFADIVGIVGLLGLAQILYLNPSTHDLASNLGLRPFDLDLAQIAAVLTIVGYSLNDKIIILDRIRENKGKLPYASKKIINDSINQTLSRTVITAGAHMITTIALYLYGGESVRGFAYTFNLGVLLGTITSIVSTPLVWSAKAELGGGSPAPSDAERVASGGSGNNGVARAMPRPAV